MFFTDKSHDEFDIYAEDKVNALVNIAKILLYLSQEEMTVSQLSAKINTKERKENNRSTYDIYAVINRLKKWGYVIKTHSDSKFDAMEYCSLTIQGKRLLPLMPYYLERSIEIYYKTYSAYKKHGFVN